MSKDKNTERDHHQGSVAAEDEQLTEALHRLWFRNEPPERLELWQIFGKQRTQRGEMIYHEDFKPGEKLDIEQANKIANEVMAAAQNDADGAGKESAYQLLIIDHNRKAQPLVRRIGPIEPKRKLSIAKVGFGESHGEDDDELDAKSINLRYAQDNMAQVRWDKSRYDSCMGHILALYDNTVRRQDETITRLMTQHITMFDRLQEAQDRALDRELVREKEKLKADLMKDGFRAARNLLPGLFSKDQPQIASQSAAPASNGEAAPKYGLSQERTLIGNFLHDCEEAKLSISLFGDWDQDENGKAMQTKSGIFSTRQFSTLYGVSEGHLPPSALDKLMPGSKHKDEVTQDQLLKAREAGVTDGIATALIEVMGLRQRAREAAEAARAATQASQNGTQEEMSQ